MEDRTDISPAPIDDSGGLSDEDTGADEYFAEQMDTSEPVEDTPGDVSSDSRHITDIDHPDDVSECSKPDDKPSRASSVGFVEYTGEDSHDDSSKTDNKDTAGGSSKTSGDASVSHQSRGKPCPAESTVWMSDIKENWDHEFIMKAFEKFKFKPKYIKIINEKTRTKMYAFVEFDSPEIARAVLLKCSERSVPGDPDRNKFHLSFANLPNQIINEYCLSVSNLSTIITDLDLFKLFGSKYNSCRGAKVHINPDGRSKGVGIVKFSNQTDQQLALVEMHKHSLKGKEIYLRLAPTKLRGPKNLLSMQQQQNAVFGNVPGLYGQPPQGFGSNMFGNNVQFTGGNRSFGNQFAMNFSNFGSDRNSYRSAESLFRSKSPDRLSYDRDRRRRSRSRDRSNRNDHRDSRSKRRARSPPSRRHRRSRTPDRKRKMRDLDDHIDDGRKKRLQPAIYYPSYVEDNEPRDAASHNELLMDAYDDYLTSLDSGKWSDFIVAANWRRNDVIKSLYPEALVSEKTERAK